MKYSRLFGKTVKNPPKDARVASHRLLLQAGFIRESSAGRYYFLPLGRRVQNKLIGVIRDEMDKAGGQEIVTPVLHPLELWEETNRVSSSNFELMLVEDRRGAKFALGGTAEEMIVAVVRQFQLSYKDLPFNIYQFSSKFRDELRARGGLLRVREFVMKDAYSFHRDQADFEQEYQNMWDTYSRIYERVGLKTDVVPADNGYFGGDYCHEFVVQTEVGESDYFVSEDGEYIAHEDIATFKHEVMNPDEELEAMKVVEQPAWVKTMEDNLKHYGEPEWRYLKNVVYKNRITGEIIIAGLRGDLDVNKNKLEKVVDAIGQLDEATDEDLAAIGTKRGYVHSWGHHKATYVADLSLKTVRNFIGGQKEENTDTRYVNYGRDFQHQIEADVAMAQEGFIATDSDSKLIKRRGVEVGNIFQLGTHYSTKMKDATFMDEDGQNKPYLMGCYGIGVGRTLATVVEMHHDERGMIWPEEIAPYQVHLLGLNLHKDVKTKERAEALYEKLKSERVEVLYDDREGVSPGVKFADADLIGIPHRVVVSARNGEQVEYKRRTESESQVMSVKKLMGMLRRS